MQSSPARGGSPRLEGLEALAAVDEVRAASRLLVRETPVYSLASLSEACGGRISVKAENLQRTGSFKLRGALSKVRALDPASCPGVVAGSAGNHAQSLAYAARWRGLRCRVFMPDGAAISKVSAVRAFGADVSQLDGDVDACVGAAQDFAAAHGYSFVHPFDDADVICGQAGLGRELLEQVPELASVVVPIGGGGLAGGLAWAVKSARPDVHVTGVQSAAWPAAATSVSEGAVVSVAGAATLADGIAIKRPGGLTLRLLQDFVDEIVLVGDEAVGEAMVFLAERAKLVAEGAGAAAVAALLTGVARPAQSGETVAIVSGGNVDVHVLARVIARRETAAGRRLRLFTRIADRPGGLADLLLAVAAAGANVLEVTHVRDGVDLLVAETGVELLVETRGDAHAHDLREGLTAAGYSFFPLHLSR